MQNKCAGNSPPEFVAKLPKMSKQLELVLYASASSFEEYANRATLVKRMQDAIQKIIESFTKKKSDRPGSSQVIDLTDRTSILSLNA